MSMIRIFARTHRFHPATLVTSLAAYLFCATASAQTCPNSGDAGTQHMTLSAEKADASCQVTNHGYVKTSTDQNYNADYKIHIDATSTGGCQTYTPHYFPPPTTCNTSTYYPRNLGTTYLYDSTFTNSYFGLVGASNPFTIMRIVNSDTNPIGTTDTGYVWSTKTYSTLGEHVITSVTNVNATPCNLTPTTFPQDQDLSINVLSCEPLLSLT